MTGIRMAVGAVLMAIGVLGIVICTGLIGYGLLFLPEMSTDKKVSETLITLLIAAWFGGLAVAGRILRRP